VSHLRSLRSHLRSLRPRIDTGGVSSEADDYGNFQAVSSARNVGGVVGHGLQHTRGSVRRDWYQGGGASRPVRRLHNQVNDHERQHHSNGIPRRSSRGASASSQKQSRVGRHSSSPFGEGGRVRETVGCTASVGLLLLQPRSYPFANSVPRRLVFLRLSVTVSIRTPREVLRTGASCGTARCGCIQLERRGTTQCRRPGDAERGDPSATAG
jgi:hypothetical protein